MGVDIFLEKETNLLIFRKKIREDEFFIFNKHVFYLNHLNHIFFS